MGPTTLFDKSFLQSLTVDESVWFDHFFTAIVCPMFYTETLADLAKEAKPNRRSPQDEVSMIADKFPDCSGAPIVSHVTLAIAELMGHGRPMGWQVPTVGGQRVRSITIKLGSFFPARQKPKHSHRWQHQDFHTIEQGYASQWRNALDGLDLDAMANTFRRLGVSGQTCHSLNDAKQMAQTLVASEEYPFDLMELLARFMNFPDSYSEPILHRWKLANYRPLPTYAPYSAYLLTVEVFFRIALAAKLIATERPSNRVDIAYLYYLPYCMVFVSTDRLHKRCAPLFLRPDQTFIWGQDLKADLSSINAHYFETATPATIEQGINAVTRYPPSEDDCLVGDLWDRFMRADWRDLARRQPSQLPRNNTGLVTQLNNIIDSEKPSVVEPPSTKEADYRRMQRIVRIKKGSWYQVPRSMENDAGGEASRVPLDEFYS